MKQHNFSPKNKDRKKAIRSILQAIILVFLGYIITNALLTTNTYVPFEDHLRGQSDGGFIAISYFGVDRSGSKTLISTKRLEEQIKALKASGYVTITQEDIKDYYLSGKALPPKALFLIFEDGRRDTMIFAQNILEKYNYKANILSYAENLEIKSSKFLSSSDIRSLQSNSYWEIGTNGYRLSYINAFDRHGNFFGQLDTSQYQMISTYLDRNYNHYLMDYIRDQYGIPIEGFDEMESRLSYDYKKVNDIYINSIGKTPGMYALMHSNTGKFGTNDRVSSVNEKWIYELFDMNFNREGYSHNSTDTSIYNLTRIQPQAYWSTNHLLMRIWDDTKQQTAFVSGDLNQKRDWNTFSGVSEFIDDRIILTSLPRDKGLMFLNNSQGYKDIFVSVGLHGNKAGSQAIYLRSDEKLNQYINIQIIDNILYVFEKKVGGAKEELFTLDLDIHDAIKYQSIEENRLESEIKYLEAQIKYADKYEELSSLLKEKKSLQAKTTEDRGDGYIPRIDILEQAKRQLEITLKENALSLTIDGKKVNENIKVSVQDSGYIALEAAFSGYGYSQRNLADDVYDGVFKELVIQKASFASGAVEILYSNRLTGFEKLKYNVNKIWEKTIDWFIKYL